MGRPARFDKKQIARAALRLVSEGGPRAATVSAIAGRIGAPTGSIYHRYPSREILLGDLWLTVVDDFQRALLSNLEGDDPLESGVAAALFGPRWVRAHLAEARLLILHRKKDFIRGDWPEAMKKRAMRTSREFVETIKDFTRRLLGEATEENVRRVNFAVLDVPYGAVRPYIETGKLPPPDLDALIEKTCRLILSQRESQARPKSIQPPPKERKR